MDPSSKRRWTYVATAVIGAIIIIAAIILLQQPIQNKTTPPTKTAPVVTTGAASGVTSSAAILNGNLALLGTASTVTVGFLYGTDAALDGAVNMSGGSRTAVAGFNVDLTDLPNGTQYYFESWALGDGFSTGSIASFTTLTPSNPQSHAPSVATKDATSVGNSTATLNGDLSALGTASSVSVGFLYGTDSALAGAMNASAGGQTAAASFDVPVSGLAPNTTYYVQAWALGDGFSNGSVVNFTTAATSGGNGNGNQVPPGWAHAACPNVPEQAPAHGVRTRCMYNETYGEWKKDHPGDLATVLFPPESDVKARTTEHSNNGTTGNGVKNGPHHTST